MHKLLLTLVFLLVSALILNCSGFSSKTGKFSKLNKIGTKLTALKKTLKKKRGRGIASMDDGRSQNSVRYRETGAHPETGKSGGRKLSIWALLDKNGQTKLHISTGDVENDTTEDGTHITKVQFKSFDTEGSVLLNKEFNNLTDNYGALTLDFADLKRHTSIQIQTNIRKDGFRRNFVVKTDTTVYLLPNLMLANLSTPEKVIIGEPAIISAEVSEMNGDIGANADCVLAVDGIELQRAEGIWVDAGDTVVCRFEQSFDTIGTKNIKISASNVKPGEYDIADNSISGTFEVINNIMPINTTYINFLDYIRTYHYRYSGWRYNQNRNEKHKYQRTIYHGNINESLSLAGANLLVEEISGPNVVSFEVTGLPENTCPGLSNVSCYDYHDYYTNQHAIIRAYTNHTSVKYEKFYEHVVYWGRSNSYSWFGGSHSSSYNYSTETGDASTRLPIEGNNYQINYTLDLGSSKYVANPVYTLQDYNYSYISPWNCWGWSCSSSSDVRIGKKYIGHE
ncbi:MAG: hypothetical protein KAQ98_03955 [Bacteriovoracaceae bacterium]|nr:hypothetical protein [Bacteriovoracaceae bacterium]